MAIFYDYTITVNENKAALNKDIYLYKDNRNIIYYFSIKNAPFKFVDLTDMIESTEATYANIKILKPNGVKKKFSKIPIENGKVKLKIDSEFIDEISEIGDYTFQIDLFDNEDGFITIPPVYNQFHVLEPLFDDEIENNTSQVNISSIDTSHIKNFSTLDEAKEIMIKQSKLNLANYLESNPLFSKCKYKDGRYYTITKEKQNQLISTLVNYMSDILPQLVIGMSTAQVNITSPEEFVLTLDNLPQTITWNDCGGVCEIYSYKELYQLKCEIFETVKPLVSIQQIMEVQINNSESIEDVLKINIDYSTENIEKYLNIVKAKYTIAKEN